MEVSIALDIDNGRRRKFDAPGAETAIRSLVPRRPNVGLMFHHGIYEGAAERTGLSQIVERLTPMKDRFLPMSRLAD